MAGDDRKRSGEFKRMLMAVLAVLLVWISLFFAGFYTWSFKEDGTVLEPRYESAHLQVLMDVSDAAAVCVYKVCLTE